MPQHLWGVVRLDAASPALQRLLVDMRDLRRSFAKWAPYVSELGVSVPATLRPATASSTALVSSLPSLLRDVPGGTLRSLALTLTAGRRDMVLVCKVGGSVLCGLVLPRGVPTLCHRPRDKQTTGATAGSGPADVPAPPGLPLAVHTTLLISGPAPFGPALLPGAAGEAAAAK